VPKLVRVVLVCNTGELGFSTGAEIEASQVWHNDGSHVSDVEFTWSANSTQVLVFVWTGTTPFIKQGNITPANWNLKVYYAK